MHGRQGKPAPDAATRQPKPIESPYMKDKSTRDYIVEAADQLFYRQGYQHTSFTDIADAVKISRGNFYHHFKTKDDILAAVIDYRQQGTQAMLAQWTAASETPQARIHAFIYMLTANRTQIMLSGCPVGTLCAELAKLEHPAQAQANALFSLFRGWLREQFHALGRQADADDLAMHALMRSQGIATLAHAFKDDRFVEREVSQFFDWLEHCLTEPPDKATP